MTKKKVFIGLNETAGYYASLNQGFKELGVKTTFLNIRKHKFNYDFRVKLPVIQRWFFFLDKIEKSEVHSKLLKLCFRRLRLLSLIICFPYYFIRNDVFIFASGETFFWGKELKLYKIFGKKVIAVFTGSDARPAYINLLHGGRQEMELSTLVEIIAYQKTKIRRLESADVQIISHPPIAQLQEKTFIQWLSIGFPRVINSNVCNQVQKSKSPEKDKVILLHSPSNPILKGTKKIKDIISELNIELNNVIDFREMNNVDVDVLIENIQNCDFIIDQLYIDTPLGGLAVEGAILGTPSVVGGYYAKQIEQDNPNKTLPPSLYVVPSEIKNAIRKMVTDGVYRRELGESANKYVVQEWSPKKVAERYLSIINDEIPDDWISDPKSIKELFTIGDENKAYFKIKELIAEHGIESLQLSDKPDLEKNILKRAKELI